jgi:tetratricopeptide (TPR) repeat protein
MTPKTSVTLALLLSLCTPLGAQSDEQPNSLAQGDYYFKAGYYLKASDAYRVAIFDAPKEPRRLLSFAHALFALGNYHWASHTLRSALPLLTPESELAPNASSMFPSRLSYMRALDDLKRYVTYNRRDRSALTVLAYTYCVDEQNENALRICGYLDLLESDDPFSSFLRARLSRAATASSGEATKPKTITPPDIAAPELEPPSGANPSAGPQAAPSQALPTLPKAPGIEELPDTPAAKTKPAISE